jgi:tetratricopeptide (TPR) repeat protein
MKTATDHRCRYEGFISYARSDERVALWLHRALEHFRIPRKLAQTLELESRRFLPFFIDKQELASSADLSATLVEALGASRNLIVICSPDAVQSRWVDEEVRRFRELGRGDRIFSVITGGDPNEPETVFPPALQSGTIPLAVELRSFRRDRNSAVTRLVAALLNTSYDTIRQRRRQQVQQRIALSAGGAAAVAAAVALVTYEVATAPPCQSSPARFAEVWNADLRKDIESAFTSTALPYASDSWKRVDQQLSSYSDEWITTHTEACAATMIRQEQSEQLMDLRMACLESRRLAFSTLVEALGAADVGVLERAVEAAGELPELAQCSDREQLLARYPMPDDAGAREKIAAIRTTVIQAGTFLSTGRVDDAFRLAQEAGEIAAQVEYPPIEAEALLLRGRAEAIRGSAETARTTLYDATSRAVLSRDGELIARAWLTLSQLLVDFEDRVDEAFDVLNVTQSYLAQVEADHPLQASFYHLRGSAMVRASRLDEGAADLSKAIELGRAAQSPELADYLMSMSLAQMSRYQVEDAERLSAEALALTQSSFGRDHPKYAGALTVAARVESRLGNSGQAVVFVQEAVEILSAVYTESSPQVVDALDYLGWTLKNTGRLEEGRDVLARALEIETSFESPRLGAVASLHNGLGDVYLGFGNLDLAEHHMQQALDAWTRQGPGTAVGVGLNNLGNLANRRRDHAAAEEYCRRALENDMHFYEETHPSLAFPLSCLGESLLGQSRPSDALEPLRRADELRDRPDVDRAAFAWTRWLHGRALAESERDVKRGMEYVQSSRKIFAEMGEAVSAELADVDAWLASPAAD